MVDSRKGSNPSTDKPRKAPFSSQEERITMDSRIRGDRSSGRSDQNSSRHSARDRHPTMWDQHIGTSSHSNPARPLDHAGNNEQRQDQPTSKLEQLADNIQRIKNEIQQIGNGIPQITKDIKKIEDEWKSTLVAKRCYQVWS